MKPRSFFCLFFLCWAGAAVSAWPAPLEARSGKQAQMRYLKASLLEKQGAFGEALQEYEEAFREDPRSSFLCREAAELALEAGRPQQALEWARRLEALEPRSASSHLLLGRVHWAQGRPEAAERSFEKALELDPASAESLFSLASLLGARSPRKGRELMERFLKSHPEHAAEGCLHMAKLDVQEGKIDEAVARLKKGTALEPDNPALRLALAEAFEMKGSTQAALAEYLEILKAEPYNAALIGRVGEIYDAMGQTEQARARFQTVVELEPANPEANLWLALDGERQGDFNQAAARVAASAALAEDAGLNLRLSYYLTQAGRLKEAVAVLEAALSRWPGNDQVAYFLALGYDDLKLEEKAVAVLQRLLQLKPDFRDARYQLAVLQERLGRIEEAERQFRFLLADRPDDASVLNYLGYSLADRGLKLEEAEALVRRAVELEPGNGAYRDSLGWALFKQGRAQPAVEELRAASSLLPEDETILDHLGDAWLAAGRPAEAWRAWKKAEALAAAASGKAESAQKNFTAEELGTYFLQHLAALHGGIGRLRALGRIEGTVAGRSFRYDALLGFDAPSQEVKLELLSPLFTPLFRVGLGPGGVAMDGLRLSGVDSEVLSRMAEGILSAIRDVLSGRLFSPRPAVYRKKWRGRFLEVSGRRLWLDASGARLSGVAFPESGQRLEVGRYEKVKDKVLPGRFAVSGPGYSVTLELEQIKAGEASP